MPYPGAQTVHRALSLLKAFTDEHPTWTVTELADRADMSRATAHRLLATLEGEGFITRVPRGGGYRLGPEVIVLGSRALRAINLRDLARPELEGLARKTDEDASLEILVDFETLIIDEVRGGTFFGPATSVGTRWPAHATATGKVLLAFSSRPPAVTTRRLTRFTDRTLTSWDDLSRALEDTRAKGYGTNIEELERGFIAIAAPILDQDGNAVAAISIGGSIHRVTGERTPDIARLLCEAGDRISRLLGHRPGGS